MAHGGGISVRGATTEVLKGESGHSRQFDEGRQADICWEIIAGKRGAPSDALGQS
jgi:hypothetical protein